MTTLSECYFRVLDDLEQQQSMLNNVVINIGNRAQQLAELEMRAKQQQAETEKAIDEVVE